ncbi:MAG: hypothetical protein KGY99_03595 [Phycisphaerae bacterium]|nr:hypothetical protein [Phycisphaerae bacterium]
MKPGLADRLLVVWLMAALVLWAACASVLWGWAVGSSTLMASLTLAGLFAAVALAAPLPWYVARAVQWVLIRSGVLDIRAVELATDGPTRPQDIRRAGRLLGAGGVFAVLAAAGSTALIGPGACIAEWLVRWTVWSPAGAAGVRAVVVAGGMVPLAVGLCVVWVLSAAVRSSGGRDAYSGAWRDMLLAAALGMAGFAALTASGAELPGLCAAAGVIALAAAIGWLVRPAAAAMPRRAVPVRGRAPRRQRVGIAAAWAVLAAVVIIQGRLLTHVLGVAMPVRTVWLAAGLALVAVFAARQDASRRDAAGEPSVGAVAGAGAALAVQVALALAVWRDATAASPAAWLALATAGAMQLPLAACAAVVLRRGRAVLAAAGGRPHTYLNAAAAGVCVGILLVVILDAARLGAPAIAALPAALLALAALRGIAAATNAARAARWGATGVLALGAVAVAGGVIVRDGWVASGLAERRGAATAAGPRTTAIARKADEIVAARPGAWTVAARAWQDVPPRLTWQQVASPELATAPGTPAQRWDGVLLAPLPAGHPDAWRYYNVSALRAAASRLRGGCLLLRTQGDASAIAAVARSFLAAVGSGRVCAVPSGRRWDVLIAGPSRVLDTTPASEWADLDVFCDVSGEVPPVRLAAPGTWTPRR